MEKTIFNVYIFIESQRQLNRLLGRIRKCDLRIEDSKYNETEPNFYYNPIAPGFACWHSEIGIKVSESEFLSLLEEYKKQNNYRV